MTQALNWLTVGVIAFLVLGNVVPWAWRKMRGAPKAVDSDMLPGADAKGYIDAMLSVPGATPEQQVAALKAGQSPADFMRTLLGKGA